MYVCVFLVAVEGVQEGIHDVGVRNLVLKREECVQEQFDVHLSDRGDRTHFRPTKLHASGQAGGQRRLKISELCWELPGHRTYAAQ